MVWPPVTNSSVLPSGAARATYSPAISPPAPARGSMTKLRSIAGADAIADQAAERVGLPTVQGGQYHPDRPDGRSDACARTIAGAIGTNAAERPS